MGKILLHIIPLGMLSSCFNLPVASTGKVTVLNSLPRAAVAKEVSGAKAISSFDPDSKVETRIQAPSGALSKSTITMPPGALNIAADLVIEESVPMSKTSVASSLNLDADIKIEPIGSGLIIRPTKNVDLTRPLTIAMSLDVGTGLWALARRTLMADPPAHYAVFYKSIIAGQLRAGVIPTSSLRLTDDNQVEFEGYFGAFWLCEVSEPIVNKVEVSTDEPTVNINNVSVIESTGIVAEEEIAAKAAIPEVQWAAVKISYDANLRTVNLSSSIGAERSLSQCQVDMRNSASDDSGTNAAADSSLIYAVKITSRDAHTLVGRFRCQDEQDRLAVSGWSELLQIPKEPDAAVASSITINSGLALTSNATVSLAIAATGAQDMYVTAVEGCASGGVWEAYSTSKSWQLTKSNATSSVYVKFRNQLAIESLCISDGIEHDDIPPTAKNLSINMGSPFTADQAVVLSLGADAASEMYISNKAGCSSDGKWEPLAVSRAWNLAQTNALASVYAQFRDTAGNLSSCISASIIHDSTAPAAASLSINGGTAYTSSSTVTLTLSVQAANEMYLSNDPSCSTGGSWEPFAASKTWNLSQTNTTASVYAKFRNAAGNVSSCINGSIIHDNLGPTGLGLTINTGASYTKLSAVTLTLQATDASQMYISNSANCAAGGSWETYMTSKNWTLGQSNATAAVSAMFRDSLGNTSSCTSSAIIHDDQAPINPTILIDSGAPYALSTTVSLDHQASGATEMYITETPACGGNVSWASFNASSNQTVAPNTATTFYAKFRDQAGNETACVSDDIQHDGVAPNQHSLTINGGANVTSSLSVALMIDAMSATEMYITNISGCATGGSWGSYSPYPTWTLDYNQSNGTASVYVKLRDTAGNESTCVGDSINHDDIPPGSTSISINSGASLTTSTTVNLGLSAISADEMYITNTSACAGAGTWEAYSSTKSWTLAQSSGTATVYVKFRDANLNESSCISDTITSLTINKTIVGNDYHSCALLAGGLVKCWGIGGGHLGQGHTNTFGGEANSLGSNLSAINLGTGRLATAIAVGESHSCALLDNGAVKCWGGNSYGQLGQGHINTLGDGSNEMGDNLAEINLGTGRTAKAIAGGKYHNCAILDDDTVKCWGKNSEGQLGLGHINALGDGASEMGNNLATVSLGTGRTAKSISARHEHSCALLDNNTVKCWGLNGSGQLGQGHTNTLGDGSNEMGDNLTAVSLGTGRTAKSVSVGLLHTCAILDTNALKCWGGNDAGALGHWNYGYLGDNASEMGDNLPEVSLGTGRIVLSIASKGNSNCALLDNSTVKCWGDNYWGGLGIGYADHRGDNTGEMGDALPAVNLGTGRTAVSVGSGYFHSCALLDNDTFKCWGRDDWHQTGKLDPGNALTKVGDQANQMGDNLLPIDF